MAYVASKNDFGRAEAAGPFQWLPGPMKVAGAPFVTSSTISFAAEGAVDERIRARNGRPEGAASDFWADCRRRTRNCCECVREVIALTVQADPLLVAVHSVKVSPVISPCPVVPSMTPLIVDFLHVMLVRLVVSLRGSPLPEMRRIWSPRGTRWRRLRLCRFCAGGGSTRPHHRHDGEGGQRCDAEHLDVPHSSLLLNPAGSD